jgi:hypothetical protein
MKTERTSVKWVNFETTRLYIPESYHTRRRENLKSHVGQPVHHSTGPSSHGLQIIESTWAGYEHLCAVCVCVWSLVYWLQTSVTSWAL